MKSLTPDVFHHSARLAITFFLLVSFASLSWSDSVVENPTTEARDEVTAGSSALVGEEHEQAIQHFSVAIQSGVLSNEELSSALIFRGTAFTELGQNQRAISDYTEALGVDPKNIEALLGRARGYNATGQFENANNDLKAIQKLGVDSAEADHIRSHTYIGLGDTEWVRAPLRAAIKLDPYVAHYWYDLSVVI